MSIVNRKGSRFQRRDRHDSLHRRDGSLRRKAGIQGEKRKELWLEA